MTSRARGGDALVSRTSQSETPQPQRIYTETCRCSRARPGRARLRLAQIYFVTWHRRVAEQNETVERSLVDGLGGGGQIVDQTPFDARGGGDEEHARVFAALFGVLDVVAGHAQIRAGHALTVLDG